MQAMSPISSSRRNTWPRIVAAALILTSVAGCTKIGDTFDRWRGKGPQPPLPGERISVLANDRSLSADKEAASMQIVLPQPTPNTSWPQAGGFANHAMHHIKVRDALTKAWSADIGDGADDEERLNGTPVVENGVVYAMDAASTVSAYTAAEGKRLWRSNLAPSNDKGHIGGGLALDGGRLFATTGFAEVVAMEAKTGKVVWRKNLGAPMRSAPTVRGGRLFAVTMNNQLFALNATSGDTLWQHRGLPEIASVLGGASPAVDQGTVVVPYTSGELIALKVENGGVLWQESLTAIRRTDVVSNLAGIRGRPVIDRGLVIAISNGGVMAAIDLRTGQRVWSREIAGIESPWVAGDYIFVLTTESEIAAVSRKTGEIIWVRGLPRFEDPKDKKDPIVWTGPILASDRLIVGGSNEEALAISPYTGRILGVQEMPDRVTVPPVVADGSVYFLADDAQLVAYR
jgi:outer membrane protein assembly factor BamB